MAKKFKLIFFIAFFLWICYIIKTKVLDLIVGNYMLGKKIEKYEKKLKNLSEKDEKNEKETRNGNDKKDIQINLFTLGFMYYDKLRDYEKALEYFQQIIAEYPNCDFAEMVQFAIGYCYEQLGRIELAVHEYKNYLQKYPEGKQATILHEKLKKLEGQAA
ncbi:MAG: hypothetical protein A2008_04225 [Candidatus Wallbacteria bacterium GWC2_49_35]|uniref:Uncharacterized protein n=1 Tax=Candidatus Wallbacteria bacterium GWC2_49_35 TaxID=1817813 RepID=A0A1F7WKV3_9BACT|nr:MAG: hypothetical protein A2008_04225 [Candidatus Wallbacteria bacterium GWC2_49_35]HBC75108.1 hypothetical protein [Candidatus Wallbacteria bacterium]